MLGAFWDYFGTWAGWQKTYKPKENICFLGIWGCLKRWLKHFFGDVGSKMPFFGHLESTCGTCWRQDGQQDGQDGQHEGQDGRQEANSIDATAFDRRESGVLELLEGLKPRSVEAQKTR